MLPVRKDRAAPSATERSRGRNERPAPVKRTYAYFFPKFRCQHQVGAGPDPGGMPRFKTFQPGARAVSQHVPTPVFYLPTATLWLCQRTTRKSTMADTANTVNCKSDLCKLNPRFALHRQNLSRVCRGRARHSRARRVCNRNVPNVPGN
jgi:hypothetical protein